MQLEFSCQIFGKSSNVKFPENLSSGCPVFPCERTVRRADGGDDVAISELQQFCERA